MKKIVSVTIITILITSMLVSAFKIPPAQASGTIYIKADGSIDPPTASIQRDGNLYTFTDSIYDPIEVQRNNTIINGAGYTLQGSGGYGFNLTSINNVTIKNTQIEWFGEAVYLSSSSNNTISNNRMANNAGASVHLASSSNNCVLNNDIVSNYIGIYLTQQSNSNTVSDNNVTDNSRGGMALEDSSYNTLKNNRISGSRYNFGVYGYSEQTFIQDADSSNTVDDKPVYYWVNRYNMEVPSHAGYVALVNSHNITVTGLELKDNYQGILAHGTTNSQIKDNKLADCREAIYLHESSNNTVSDNNLTNNDYGITLFLGSKNNTVSDNNAADNYCWGIGLLWDSSNNRVLGNDISNNGNEGVDLAQSSNNIVSGNDIANNSRGISLFYSSNSKFYHNDFMNNPYQIYDQYRHEFYDPRYFSMNVWDDGYPSGGNYWSNYSDVDVDNDGIWDHPYVIDTNNSDNYPLVNPWTPIPPNQPPNCVVRLQKDGIEITEIGVEQFFDIYVGASSDDTGITKVRFSNDDVRDGNPTGLWTQWYDWSVSSSDWNAATKIRRWAFYSPGFKEVWAEIKDGSGHSARCSASIYAPAPALPVLVSPLVISPVKDMYAVGDSITAEFTVRNVGETPITLDKLTLGGRVNGWLETDGYPDFTYRLVTLQPNADYLYSGSLTFTKTGNYRFFIAYNIVNPNPDEKKLLDENNWNTCIELDDGLSQTSRVRNIVVFDGGTIPGEPEALRETVRQMIRLSPYISPYLLGTDSWKESVATLWAGFTSWATQTDLTGKYDELYYNGIDYYGLRLKALKDANSALDRGDTAFAKKCVERAQMYDKLAHMSFAAAIEVFDGNMQAGEVLAQGIKDGCETVTKLGIKVLCPEAGIAADAIYMIMNFGFNNFIEGQDKATIDMAVDAVFILAFQSQQFQSLNLDTLETYVNNVGGTVQLSTLFLNEEFMNEFGTELVAITTQTLSRMGISLAEDVRDMLVKTIVQRLVSLGDSITSKPKCPVDPRIYDSEGLVAGVVNGKVRQEIPMSLCYNGTIQIFFINDSYSYEIVGKDTGTYDLTIAQTKDGNNTVFNATNIPISTNETHTYDLNWVMLSQAAEGASIYVDSDSNGIFEFNFTSDNELSRFEYVAATTGHDLGIAEVTSSKSVVGEGYVLPVNMTVVNYGVYTETFNLTIYANDTLLATQTVTLANASSTTVSYAWNTTGFAKGNYTLSAYAEPVIGEAYVADNNQTGGMVWVGISGDVNADGKVDVKDVYNVALAYGTSLEGPNPNGRTYNSDCDINSDNKVDVKDYYIVCKHYGEVES